MMKCLRTINVDNNTVGWYQSSIMGSYLTQVRAVGLPLPWPHIACAQYNIEAQYTYQKAIPTSVMLVYDPYRTSGGHLQLRAYRLTAAFMKLYAEGKFTAKA